VPPSNRLVSPETGRVLATDARWLAHFWERGRGWLARKPDPNLALGIPLAAGERLHALGMHFALDIAYCDSENRVLQVLTLSPFRIAPAVPGAVLAWELLAGKLAGVQVGESLQCD
jgi:uncharacterized membrane protein (UPF0127 family)